MKFSLPYTLAVTLLIIAVVAPPLPAQDATRPIRVLILTGRNNHRWQETTPKLKQILESAGGIQVETTVPPEGLDRENLASYDVILSNWNSWGKDSKDAEAAWTPDVRKAYLDFVRGGKGHVTVHAGGSSFYEGWPEYHKVALVYWKLGETGHGHQHEFKVRIDRREHVATKSLSEFSIRDELWNRPGVTDDATVVASAFSDSAAESHGTGQWEPSAVIADYGKGRCFATLLGHDATTMENAGFQASLIAGVRWAAGAASP